MASTIPARIPVVTIDGPADCSNCGAEGTPHFPVFVASGVHNFERLCATCFDTLDAEATLRRPTSQSSWLRPWCR